VRTIVVVRRIAAAEQRSRRRGFQGLFDRFLVSDPQTSILRRLSDRDGVGVRKA
jgi:hypothetical protein